MPKDQLDRCNLDLAYPPFLERLCALLANCNARGNRYIATELHRPYERSEALYKAYRAGGPRAAPAGASGHNFGLAVDLVLDADAVKPGLQLGQGGGWSAESFKVAMEEATKLGLKCGAAYHDFPHFEWPTFVSAAELAPLDRIYRATPGIALLKLKACWAYADLHAPHLPEIT